MTTIEISHELRSIIIELEHVRRGLMNDGPRRATFEWANRAKTDAEQLLAVIERDVGAFVQAAE